MKQQININNYILDQPLACKDSGFSKWGIGKRGGKTYFLKEFLSPAYPVEDGIFDEKRREARIQVCEQFEAEKKTLYRAVFEASDGNLVYIRQFFRVGARYYISTDAVTGPVMSVEEIAHSLFIERIRICCTVAHAMAGLHAQHVIHSDIKPDNIMVIRRRHPVAKIIDFDSSFFDYACPKLGEELNGDMVYLSPEGFLHIAEEESNLSCKMDVFALGLLFHQYITGRLPGFDRTEYQYAYESVLDDHPLDVSAIEFTYLRNVIEGMVKKDPDERPSMETVFQCLRNMILQATGRKAPDQAAATSPKESEPDAKKEEEKKEPSSQGKFFHAAGDL